MKWKFAIVSALAFGLSVFGLKRTLECGNVDALPFGVAYVAACFSCLLGSSLPFLRSRTTTEFGEDELDFYPKV